MTPDRRTLVIGGTRGTGLLIVVSVSLDLVQRIEANLLMRNYSGFLSTGEQGRVAGDDADHAKVMA